MPEKPTYEELEKRVRELEKEATERGRVEEALRESERRYRDIFENVSDFLYLHDLEGNFTETNLAFKQEEYGFTEEDAAHLNIRDLLPDHYQHQFEGYLKRVEAQGKDEGLMSVMIKDGRERLVEYRNSLVYDATGPVGVRGSARDITERRRAEEASKRAAALETLTAVLQNFISDSLANLLFIVYAQLGIGELSTSTDHLRGTLRAATQGLTELIQATRAYQEFSSLREGSLGAISSVALPSILEPLLSGKPLESYDKKEFQIDPKVRLRFAYDPTREGALSWEELPSVAGSRNAVATALQETLINAVESYHPGKGGDVVVSARRDDHKLVLEIADKGRGMSNEERVKSQLPFYKITCVKGSARLGLGAYIARQSARYCGGDIHLESTEGCGTTASILLKVSNQVS